MVPGRLRAWESAQGIESGVLDPKSRCELGQGSFCLGLSICTKRRGTRFFPQSPCNQKRWDSQTLCLLGACGAKLNPVRLHPLDHPAPCWPVTRCQSRSWLAWRGPELLQGSRQVSCPLGNQQVIRGCKVAAVSLLEITFFGPCFQMSHFMHLFSKCSQGPPLCQGWELILPLRNTQFRKDRTGHTLLPYRAERKRWRKCCRRLVNLAVSGFSSPWYSFVWLKSPNRWLFWVE